MPRTINRPAVETHSANLVEYMIVPVKHQGTRLTLVCTAKHREGKVCRRCLAAPQAIWRGWWPKDEFGDLRSDLKAYRRTFRNAKLRWKSKLKRLNNKRPRVAPAFLAYFEDALKAHMATEPVFMFQPRETFTRAAS
jgi:hypothetical protein